jgi:FAD:protein FMN transferase
VRWHLSVLMALLAGALTAAPGFALADPDPLVRHGEQVMGTNVTLAIRGVEPQRASSAAAAAFAELRRIDELMSDWREDSDISRVNAAAGARAVKVNPEVLAVVRRAVEAGRDSGGAFDVTVGAFRGLWRFDEDLDESIPADEDIAARTALVDYQRIEIDEQAGTLRLAGEGMRITLGGIAKGYAVDRAVAILRERGVRHFILQAGGDLYVSGTRGDRPWRVGIRDPRGARHASFAIVDLEDATFSTSGDYERGFIKDGVRYHHILDPKTGRPAQGSRSVTVLANDALTADVWSTALFVMGPERGLARVERLGDIEAVFVDADNAVHVSSGLKNRLRVLHPPTDAP